MKSLAMEEMALLIPPRFLTFGCEGWNTNLHRLCLCLRRFLFVLLALKIIFCYGGNAVTPGVGTWAMILILITATASVAVYLAICLRFLGAIVGNDGLLNHTPQIFWAEVHLPHMYYKQVLCLLPHTLVLPVESACQREAYSASLLLSYVFRS